MRIRGFKKRLFILTSARPELDRKLLQAARSLDSVRQLLQNGGKEAVRRKK